MRVRRKWSAATAVAAAVTAASLVAGCAGSTAPAAVDAGSSASTTTPVGTTATADRNTSTTGSVTSTVRVSTTAPVTTIGAAPVSNAAAVGTTDPVAVPTPAPATTAATGPTPPLLAGLATDPAGLGAQLTGALRTIVDPSSSPGAVEAAGQRQQFVIRRLAAHQDWQTDALAAVAHDVRDIAANDVAAINAPGNAALAKPVPPKPTIPAWRIRAPLPARELLGYYQEAEGATGIEWAYLAAINLVETRMGRIVGLSGDGAVGPMQFLPSTWAACCQGDPAVDHDAIVGAANYLVRRGGPGDMARAILGYNPNNAYLEMIQRYADNLRTHPALLAGYHAWQVFVGTTEGPIRLPVGFATAAPLDAATYLAAHPEDRA